MIFGVDTSNHNHPGGARIDWPAVAASGRRFAVLKASEGLGFEDGYLAGDRDGAHAAGLLVGLYHFARGNDPAAEARWFLQCVGPLRVGEFVVLDDEVTGVTPGWVQAWCDAVFAATTVKPLVYLNQSTQNGQNWSGVVADNDGEWLARYDGTTAQPSGGAWGAPAMKQYDDAGSVAGIAGGVDLDVFYGTPEQLAAYGLHGTTPTVQEDDMDLVRDTSNGFVYVVGEFSLRHIPDPPTYQAYIDAGATVRDLSPEDIALLAADIAANRAAFKTELHDYFWTVPAQPPDGIDGKGTPDPTWPADRLRGIDGGVGQIKAAVAGLSQPQVDPAALGAALAASPSFVQALVSQIVAGLDADLSHRFGTTT